jgi:hypothetical protein
LGVHDDPHVAVNAGLQIKTWKMGAEIQLETDDATKYESCVLPMVIFLAQLLLVVDGNELLEIPDDLFCWRISFCWHL